MSAALLEEADTLLAGLGNLISQKNPLELAQRMEATRKVKRLHAIFDSLRGAPIVTVAAPVAMEPANEVTARLDKKEFSLKLKGAMGDYLSLKRLLSSAIKNDDKTIISINTPARSDQKAVNNFNKSEEVIMLVFATNTAAYVVTRTDNDIYSITAAKYWSLPEFNPRNKLVTR